MTSGSNTIGRDRMTDSSDVQHHLERGLFLLSRGLVYEARQSWRAALRIDPANSVAQDYLDSTESELNDYDRKREAAARAVEDTAHGAEFEEFSEVDAQRMAAAQVGLEAPVKAPAREAAEAIGEPETASAQGSTGTPEASEPEAAAGETGEPLDQFSPARDDGLTKDAHQEAELEAPPVLEQQAAEPSPTDASPPEAGTSGAGTSDALVSPTGPLEEDLNFEEMGGDDWQPLDWSADEEPLDATSSASQPSGVEPILEEGPGTKDVVTGEQEETSEDSADTVSAVLEEVAKLRRSHRYGAARRLLQEHLTSHPGQEALLEELERVERDMQAHYSGILGDLSSVPELTVDMEELYSLDLDQVGGYIISLVDGILTLEDIFTLSAKVDRLTVMQVLGELIEKELVTLRPG